MAVPLLATKLYIPPPRPGLVPRPRLHQRLSEGLRPGHRLTLISAPAGFGKTTLLSAWVQQFSSMPLAARVKFRVLRDGMEEMEDHDRKIIELSPIGFVSRTSSDENERDRSLVAKVVFDEDLAPALDGIEEWSHVYVIFWLDRVVRATEPELYHQSSGVGIFAARSPIHPNPIGLTLVELVKREENVLWVRGLDAYQGTPVVDIKPYPDWEQGHFLVVTDFKAPGWLTEIIEGQEGVDEAGG